MLLCTLLWVWLFAAIMMSWMFYRQTKTKDASYVDVAWAFGIGLCILGFSIIEGLSGLRHYVILLCGLFWSIRLGWHLYHRLTYLGHEDSRYETMRKTMGEKANLGFFWFFQLQAIFVVMFAMPMIIALMSPSVSWSSLDTLGMLIFIFAFTGEFIADKQLLAHRKAVGASKTCQSGLWYYSRHPNYFFEWVHWFAYAAFAYSSSYFWLALIMPFFMLFFIVYVTGIPHTEREALKKRKDYKQYQETTSMLIPWFKRK